MEIKARNRMDAARQAPGQFSKMLLVSGTALALSCGSPDNLPCDSGNGGAHDAGTDSAMDGGSGGTDASCVPRTPVCVSQSNSFLADKGMVVPVGDYRIRLDDTMEVGSEQVAVVSRVDTCNELQGSSIEVVEDAEGTFTFDSVTIRVAAAGITVLSPQQARLTVDLECPDSGISDGGSSD